ncbi:Protein of unknown function (DUF2806) [Leptolyngbya sp. PCC 7375]|nr:Protein of unknown function (DUF2806) [Leptolyngbya sp. PCC 7375]
MEIKDLAGFSKPLTRLIEVISKGIGAVFASYLIRDTADARSYEIRTISAALREVGENHNLSVIYKKGEIEIWQKPNDQTLILDAKGIDERSNLRLNYQERKRQANIENVTSIAAAELIDDESITTEQPDEDWISRFFNSAQDISSEQMQNLWGLILAGEIRQPGTYSLRTLDLLRNLKTREAEVIAKVGKMALNGDNKSFFIDAHDKQWLEKERGLVDSHIFELRELAILHPSDLDLELFDKSTVDEHIFYFGKQLLRIQRSEIKTPVRVRGWKFTTVGQELLSLLPFHIDNEYLENLGRFFVKHKGKAFIGSIVERHPDGKIGYKIIREIVD